MPRIVVLDGYTLTPARPGEAPLPGEPDWSELEKLGDLAVYDRTGDEQVVGRAAGAEIVLTNKTLLSAAVIEQLEALRYIGVLATGTNVVDLAAARQREVVVTNVPGYSTDSVAQHVFALLLELASQVSAHDRAVHAGEWAGSDDFSFRVAPLVELGGKTLGIVGLGTIGRRVARIGAAMGMKIAAAHQRSMHQVRLPGVEIEWLELDDLLPRADVLSLHCPLTERTQGMMNAERLARMKSAACLINTGRGPLIDEDALAAALRDGRLAGAGLDVLSSEPPAADNPLLIAPRCIITPHVAWATQEARQRLMASVAGNVRAFLADEPVNVVS